jgi:hypothetical protein
LCQEEGSKPLHELLKKLRLAFFFMKGNVRKKWKWVRKRAERKAGGKEGLGAGEILCSIAKS